jgi:FkbM family methyltransferase
MKIIFITPHLSTGGMPEYLRKKVEILKNDNQVWVFELHTEWAYRIIRDKIENLIGDNLVSINQNFSRMLELIREISPDVIHFEELSDYHVPYDILDQIYTSDRKWKIFETFHDSSIEAKEKRFLPDKMLVVSAWQQKMMADLGVPIEVINHEIIGGVRNRDGLTSLGLDPKRKHVMQVGLFSRRKNQAETFELARLMPDVHFHFLGGQTDNYSYYWKPLLQNKPDNCHIWGERSDVERFYSCFDAVIFPSRGDYGDRETNPLAIREANAWKIPLFMRDLPVYMGMYREGELVKFMTDDFTTNSHILRNLLKLETNQNIQNKTTTMIQDNSFYKQKLFNITFSDAENKITFEYLQKPPINFKICVRDIDTEVPIYSFDATFNQGGSVWCIPIPKRYYDFARNPNFGGFLYDFYDMTGEKVYSQATRIKRSAISKSKFRIESFDPIFVNYEQFFTDKIYDKFFEKLNKLDLVVDVGANVGLFTELSLQKGAKKVISLEVNRKSIETFQKIHSNNDSISLIPKGLSNETGFVDIYINPENSLISSTLKSHDSSLNLQDSVEMIGLSDLIKDNKLKKIDLIKIDVEGSEYSIFDRASIEDLSKIGAILLEFHDNFGNILNDSIISKLEGAGFTYEIYQDDCVGIGNDYEERGTIFAIRK